MNEKLIEQMKAEANKGDQYLYDFFIENNLANEKLIEKIKNCSKKDIISEHYPYKKKMNKADYEKEKKFLQIELLKCQNWIKENKKRFILLFEGRDAAGKGGTIKRFTEHLNPRGAKVVALQKPSQKELGQWYFQRYVDHFPSFGDIVFFDRSWYNRAGVEKVMNFCNEQEYTDFVNNVPSFEKMIQDSGIALFKFWFSVSQNEQMRRFLSRLRDPLKRWKISPIDIASLKQWKNYTEAKESMFYHTDYETSPWFVIRSDCKKRARLNAIRFFLSRIPYKEKNKHIKLNIDHQIIGRADEIYEPDELIQRKKIVSHH